MEGEVCGGLMREIVHFHFLLQSFTVYSNKKKLLTTLDTLYSRKWLHIDSSCRAICAGGMPTEGHQATYPGKL